MKISRLSNGLFESNTWLIAENEQCAVIDCGSPVDDILKEAQVLGSKITHIILTHGHVDHVFSIDALKAKTGATIYIHEDEKSLYMDSALNGYQQFGMGRSDTFPILDVLVKDDDIIKLGELELRVIHTPGHTAGGICILFDGHLFTGDTLFFNSIGRYDLPTGNGKALIKSIREKIYILPGETILHPGHGADSSIDEERNHNPYVTG